MDQFYNNKEAMVVVADILCASKPHNLQLHRFQMDGGLENHCSVTKDHQSKSWKLTTTDSNGYIEEVVLRVQGILCSKLLPPIIGPFAIDGRIRPYLKQSVSLTALGKELFQNAVESIEDIHCLFSRHFPQGVLEGWVPSQFDSSLAIDAANRYYTHRSLSNIKDIIPFSSDIDPQDILKNGLTEKYVHTTENVVEYYEKQTVGEQKRYVPIGPVKFQCGDIVEAQLSFQTVGIRNGKQKFLVVLRALTLLDAHLTKEASVLRNRSVQHSPILPTNPIKRKVGYHVDEETAELTETQERINRMRIDSEHNM